MIKCGVHEVCITPPIGNTLPGSFTDRRSTGIKDELFAKALVVESDGSFAVLIAIDCLDLTKSIVERIRTRIHEFTGIAPANVMVSATHTHLGPPVFETTFININEAYAEWMSDKAADAAIMAYQTRKVARIGFGYGYEADIAFNRRFYMKDGSVRTNPGVGNPEIDRPVGPIDPQVLVVRIDDEQGQPIGVITNYACHVTTMGGTEYSGDYPGVMARTLKQTLGNQVVSLFFSGACGDINYINAQGWEVGHSRTDHYKKMGRILAGEVLKVREKISTKDELVIETKQVFFPIDNRKPTEAELIQAAKDILLTEPAKVATYHAALEVQAAANNSESSVEVEIQAVRLGDMAVVGLPAEIFVEFGLELKANSCFPLTMVNELTNGSARGYVCTREAYRQGGYEPRITSQNKLDHAAGEIFVQQALSLLQQFHK